MKIEEYKPTDYAEHICQYCGALTNEPDSRCFKRPPDPPMESDGDGMVIISGIRFGMSGPPPAIKGHGQLKEFEVWSSGYVATGESAPAHFHGKFKARTFREACDICFFTAYLEQVKKDQIEEPEYSPQRQEWTKDRFDYDRQRLTYWACTLHDNETDARKFNN